MTNQLIQRIWWKRFLRIAYELQIDWMDQFDGRFELASQLYVRHHGITPAVIVQTLDPKAIGRVLQLAKEFDVPIAVRGSGTDIAGRGTRDGGIIMDFSQFQGISVDASTHIATVQPGAHLEEAQSLLSDLSLRGGSRWLIGLYGLSCEGLIGADVVLANGSVIESEDPGYQDLLPALRDGEGTFGVVTAFRFRTSRS